MKNILILISLFVLVNSCVTSKKEVVQNIDTETEKAAKEEPIDSSPLPVPTSIEDYIEKYYYTSYSRQDVVTLYNDFPKALWDQLPFGNLKKKPLPHAKNSSREGVWQGFISHALSGNDVIEDFVLDYFFHMDELYGKKARLLWGSHRLISKIPPSNRKTELLLKLFDVPIEGCAYTNENSLLRENITSPNTSGDADWVLYNTFLMKCLRNFNPEDIRYVESYPGVIRNKYAYDYYDGIEDNRTTCEKFTDEYLHVLNYLKERYKKGKLRPRNWEEYYGIKK